MKVKLILGVEGLNRFGLKTFLKGYVIAYVSLTFDCMYFSPTFLIPFPSFDASHIYYSYAAKCENIHQTSKIQFNKKQGCDNHI